jgi:NAD(P)-dependent dehydrogenase (short-subunit alcohol dehydrogenase family)
VGFAAAKALASASNIFQVILASRSLSKGSTVKAEIEAGGIKGIFSAIQFDVRDEVSVSEAVVHVQQFGRLDVPINDAGLLGTMEDNIKTRFKTVLGLCYFSLETRIHFP